MKATRINSEHAKEVINNVKSVIRLGGFETGLRTNLNKAINLCNGSYSTTYSSPEYLFEKEYQLEVKARFTNFLNESYEIWFEESKIYTFENEGEKFLIVTGLGYCNVYQLIQKDKNEFCQQEGNTLALWNALCKQENKYNRVFEGVDIYFLANNLRETFELQ